MQIDENSAKFAKIKLLMTVPSSSVNMERLSDGNVERDTRVDIHVRK